MPGEGILADDVLCHSRQPVESAAQIGRHGADENANGWVQGQHEVPLRASTTRRRVWGSKPGATATRSPSPRTTSMGEAVTGSWPAGGGGEQTTGRNSGVPLVVVTRGEPGELERRLRW